MKYDRALRHLDAHINLEAKAGRIEGLSLDRIGSMVSMMGDPHLAYPVIHVTGTNGKGSTTMLITELLRAHGLVVGTYTSPHLERINERIRIDGVPISDDEFAAAVTTVAGLESLVDGAMSYFELVTAAAFGHFSDVAVDVAVIEVGLLGRWDATNVVDAAVAVVTNVGRDHTDGVGDWRQAVATEKAGIIKENSLLVLGETAADLVPIFTAEPSLGSIQRDLDFEVLENRIAVGGRGLDIRTPHRTYNDVFVALHGTHQGDNAAIALAAAEAFFGGPIEEELVAEAFAAVKVPGRFEVAGRHPLVLLDAAHNPDGARAAIETLGDFGAERPRYLVLGLLQGRDIGEMLDALEADDAELLLVCEPDWPRRILAADIAKVAQARQIPVEVVPSIEEAVERALSLAGDDDVVLVTGSNYVIGPARTLLAERADS